MPTPAFSRGFLALLAGATGIGFAPIFVRLSEIGPSAIAFYRLLFALPLLWAWWLVEQKGSPAAAKPRVAADFRLLAIAGLLFTADLATWHWSLTFTSVANSTLLANFAPFFVTLGAWLLFHERAGPIFMLGMLVAFAGAALLLGASFELSRRHVVGDLLAIVAAVFYGGYLLTVKHLRQRFSTATIMAWSGVISTAGFLLVSLASRERLMPHTPKEWGILVALALVSHVGGQTLIAYAFGHLPAGVSSLNLLLQPVVAALVAWLILAEPLSGLQMIGGVIVLAGILVGNITRR